ncbi:hypothetical protein KJ780_01080 [Candidatus Micrarchaeota archaeon]|nr:hypothetical protein [Candidatus Micrarchaeota archaeon]
MVDAVQSFADFGSVGVAAVGSIATSIVDMLPSLIAAIIVFVLGWLVAVIVSRIFKHMLDVVKMEEFLESHRVHDALGSVKLTGVLVQVLKIYIILYFLQAALTIAALGSLGAYLYTVLLYVPVLIGAFVIFVGAALAGEYIKEKILELGKSGYLTFMARGSKFVIVLIGALTALDTAGFSTTLIDSLIVTVVQAVAVGMGLAFGIAFGLGGQDEAKGVIKNVRKTLKV